jgi:hypothetical protein
MIAKIRAKLRQAREKLRVLIKRRHAAQVGSERRKELARKVREARQIKEVLAQRLEDAKAHKGTLAAVKVNPAPGSPHWGGGGDVVAQFVEPFMVKRGLPIGSGKRTPAQNQAVGGSPTSDHLTTHTTAMARDFPTYSGADDAAALAKAMGINSWHENSYAAYIVRVDGEDFSTQILWGAAIGHGDHVHVGVRAA